MNDKSCKRTLEYYRTNGDRFANDTFNADMSDVRRRFMNYLPHGAFILDFGCGSGRDAKAFLESGFLVGAVDGSAEMCRLAGELTGLPVRPMLFRELDALGEYDGIWACASILHIPYDELPDIFRKMRTALKSRGVIYVSFKYGEYEGERNGRYYTDMTEERFSYLLKAVAGLTVIDYWRSADVRTDHEDEQWLNILLRKEQ